MCTLCFSSSSLRVSDLWSLWNICSWFLYRMRDKNCFILLHLDIQFQRCSPFFPNVYFWPLWKNQVAVVVCFCIWVIYSIPLMKVSVIMPVPCCFYYYGPILQLKVKCGDTCLSFVFSLLMCLVWSRFPWLSGSFMLPYMVKNNFYSYEK